MGLRAVGAEHHAVRCDGPCGQASVEICCKRMFGVEALDYAVRKLRQLGWHVDALGTMRSRWYCPKCRGRNV